MARVRFALLFTATVSFCAGFLGGIMVAQNTILSHEQMFHNRCNGGPCESGAAIP